MPLWPLRRSVCPDLVYQFNVIDGGYNRIVGLVDEGRHHLLQLPDRRLVPCGRFWTGTWMLLLLAVPLL